MCTIVISQIENSERRSLFGCLWGNPIENTNACDDDCDVEHRHLKQQALPPSLSDKKEMTDDKSDDV